MILYFANRKMQVLGHASTHLPEGFVVHEDLKTEDVETGISSFSCRVSFYGENRSELESMAEAGNFILRKNESETEFYTIIEAEIDTKEQDIYIYAEDAGLDLLNEIVGEYEATEAKTAAWYFEKYIYDSGFEIGVNEIPESSTRKLSWDGESTAAERVASIATQFGNYEISYSFDIVGMEITHKYLNIYKERGKDVCEPLYLNRDIDRIITKKTIANLATALKCKGGTPEKSDKPITLKGYEYDDGDFYVSGDLLKSRNALAKWSRYQWEGMQTDSQGHIVQQYSYDTTSQKTLCEHAITELKKICDLEINYEAEINRLPEGVKVGDRINIIDDAGELYLSTRILLLETSVCDRTQKATLGEYLIKGSGISQKVAELAAKFAEMAYNNGKLLQIANSAKEQAEAAKGQAEAAAQEAQSALTKAQEAESAANTATQSAGQAQEAANAAQEKVESVETKVSGLETTIQNANEAAENAHQAAQTATQKAEEAKTAADNAVTDAEEAKTAAGTAQSTADNAIVKAEEAKTTAGQAKTTAEEAQSVAAGAKADAQKAQEDINAFGENLETLESTMQADYARKTDLTEATASLQTQITRNANEISSTASRVTEIDETANNAAELAESAQAQAQSAQSKADAATAEAEAAQTAADQAKAAAQAAQSEADNAKSAAATAQSVADKAKEDLEAAQADLATVQGRVDATEEEIAAAEQAVANAQAAADKAQTDANTAATKAQEAQGTANTAVDNAAAAQLAANNAATKADNAQKAADKAQGDATAAQEAATAAQNAANAAQETANTAKTNAQTAQTKANEAAQAAAEAQAAADDADAKAAQAQTDLNTAKQNLANVTSRVDATEEEVEAAKAAVVTAQAAADQAAADAATAQSTANTAKANAATAQTAANNAKTAAGNAQDAADAAQAAADKAQADVNSLTSRVTTAETQIAQNSEQIALRATKTEVAQTLGGYYTKEQTDAAITTKADSITSQVSRTYATKQEVKDIEIGGRNLLYDSKGPFEESETAGNYGSGTLWNIAQNTYTHGILLEPLTEYVLSFDYAIDWGTCTPITPTASIGIGSTPGAFEADFTGNTASYYGNGKYYTTTDGGYPLTGRFEFVFTTPNVETLESKPYFAMRPARTSTATALQNSTFTCSNFKLEKGNKPTGWTPAPEDMATSEDVDGVHESLNETNDGLSSTNERVLVSETLIQQLSDAISLLVVDDAGTTLLEQTGEGWTFNLVSAESTMNTLSQSLDALQQETRSTEATVDVLKTAMETANTKLSWVEIGEYEKENGEKLPCIELGKRESDSKLLITNEDIMFQVGTEAPTRINTSGIVTRDIVVENDLRQDEWVWKRRSNGNYGLQWKAVSI